MANRRIFNIIRSLITLRWCFSGLFSNTRVKYIHDLPTVGHPTVHLWRRHVMHSSCIYRVPSCNPVMHPCIKYTCYSLGLHRGMNEWTDTSLRYRHWRMCTYIVSYIYQSYMIYRASNVPSYIMIYTVPAMCHHISWYTPCQQCAIIYHKNLFGCASCHHANVSFIHRTMHRKCHACILPTESNVAPYASCSYIVHRSSEWIV